MSEQDSEENTSFLDHEKWHSTRAGNEEKSTLLSRMFRKNITWAVLGCLFSSLFFAVLQLRHGHGWLASTRPQLIPGESFWPDIPEYTRVFVDDEDWKDTGVVGDVLWNELLPVGGGYVPIPYPRRYNLPESAPFERSPDEAEVYATSSVHQLHCLATLRETLKSYGAGETPRYGGKHPYHCLNYLRQGVLCAADTTLEYGHPVWNEEKQWMEYDFSGIGAIHQCRDWNTVKDFMLKHRASNESGIA